MLELYSGNLAGKTPLVAMVEDEVEMIPDVRAEEEGKEFCQELLDLAVLCVGTHKKRPLMNQILEKLTTLEMKSNRDLLTVSSVNGGEKEKTCETCFVEFRESQGVMCSCEQNHFICLVNGCLSRELKRRIEEFRVSENGNIPCFENGVFEMQKFSAHIDKNLFEKWLEAMQRKREQSKQKRRKEWPKSKKKTKEQRFVSYV